ncbi:MAG: hypothetical protein KF852_19955 [Saprospiraceae bacterium]|nr:hypothetical protein [Saprospiraceae bacterium]
MTFGNTPTAIEIINSQDETVPFNSVPGTVTFGGGGGGNPTGFTLTIASASNVMNGQQVCLNVTAQKFQQHHRDAVFDQLQPGDVAVCLCG